MGSRCLGFSSLDDPMRSNLFCDFPVELHEGKSPCDSHQPSFFNSIPQSSSTFVIFQIEDVPTQFCGELGGTRSVVGIGNFALSS